MKRIDQIFSHILYGQGRPQNIQVFLRLPLTVLCYHISNCSTKHEKAINVSNQKLYMLI